METPVNGYVSIDKGTPSIVRAGSTMILFQDGEQIEMNSASSGSEKCQQELMTFQQDLIQVEEEKDGHWDGLVQKTNLEPFQSIAEEEDEFSGNSLAPGSRPNLSKPDSRMKIDAQ